MQNMLTCLEKMVLDGRRLGTALCNWQLHRTIFSGLSQINCTVLGIETSCDDTGVAIVNSNGKILGEALHSQQQVHTNNGGIIPPIARDLHKQHIESVVNRALESSKCLLSDIDAIAVTVKPGLALSLLVGMNYAKQLSRTFQKPLIPIHHMEAHALTVRLVKPVKYPFLVLLISGGHCLLALASSVQEFQLLGSSLDDAPGEAMDKTCRRMKLHNLAEFRTLSGGAAIQLAASRGDPLSFDFPFMLSQYRDCNFSLAGLKNTVTRHILAEEKRYGIEADGIIPSVYDLCASFQLAVATHLARRLQRAFEYVAVERLIPDMVNRTLVISGGVACNGDIVRALGPVCEEYGYRIAVPPPELCTDNGVMIAWNGVERYRADEGIMRTSEEIESVDIQAKCTLGEDRRSHVSDANIKCKWVKLEKLAQAIISQTPSVT